MTAKDVLAVLAIIVVVSGVAYVSWYAGYQRGLEPCYRVIQMIGGEGFESRYCK